MAIPTKKAKEAKPAPAKADLPEHIQKRVDEQIEAVKEMKATGDVKPFDEVKKETPQLVTMIADEPAAEPAPEAAPAPKVAPKDKIVTPSKQGFAALIKSVNEADPNEYLTGMFYGRSGAGKTTIAATFAELGPVLFLDIREQGTKSLKGMKNVDFVSINSWDELSAAFDYLEAGNHPYKTVVVDTLTQAHDIAMEKVLMDAGLKPNAQPYQQHWGMSGKLVKQLVLELRKLPINRIFIAQERTNNVDSTAAAEQLIPEVGADLPPGVNRIICAAMDFIGHVYIDEQPVKQANGQVRPEIQHRLRLAEHRNYTAKVRKPKDVKIPAFIVNGGCKEIVAIMNGKSIKE
jgi:ABC-type dipeptide/oligopeptide/nickel transport system ATPase subunit